MACQQRSRYKSVTNADKAAAKINTGARADRHASPRLFNRVRGPDCSISVVQHELFDLSHISLVLQHGHACALANQLTQSEGAKSDF